jgi:hypothetical protein
MASEEDGRVDSSPDDVIENGRAAPMSGPSFDRTKAKRLRED